MHWQLGAGECRATGNTRWVTQERDLTEVLYRHHQRAITVLASAKSVLVNLLRRSRAAQDSEMEARRSCTRARRDEHGRTVGTRCSCGVALTHAPGVEETQGPIGTGGRRSGAERGRVGGGSGGHYSKAGAAASSPHPTTEGFEQVVQPARA